jgi:hypothetical protein
VCQKTHSPWIWTSPSIGDQTPDFSNTPIINDGVGFTTRGYDLHPKRGIVVFIDVLGMKGIWRKFSPIEVVSRWNKVIRSFMDSLERHFPGGGYFFRIISDTIVITLPADLNSLILNRVFDILLKPFIESIKIRMLLRGAISYGTYYLSSRLIIGEALDDAAYDHDKLNWIGISVSRSLSQQISKLDYITTNSSVLYDKIPHKVSPYRGIVLNWPNFDNQNKCYTILKKESINSGPSIKPKYDNTFMFYHGAKLV